VTILSLERQCLEVITQGYWVVFERNIDQEIGKQDSPRQAVLIKSFQAQKKPSPQSAYLQMINLAPQRVHYIEKLGV
jgi:hypothetical protein